MTQDKGSVDLDSVLLELGQFGRFQIRNYCFILLPILFCAVYNSQYIFAAADVNYRCKVPECESSPPQFSTNGWGGWVYPDGGGRCERLRPVATTCEQGSFHPKETKRCEAWVYEDHNSIVSEFDLACEEWKRTMVGTIHSAGLFVALPLTAYISDTFGRRIAFILTSVAPALMGLVRSFVNNYYAYIVLEFLESAVGAGVYSSGFILALEMVGLNKRVLGGNIISSTFAIGQAVVALIAWAIPEWRTLTRVIYVPSFLFIFYYFVIEESVRWLLSKGNKKEAARIIFKVAAVNKKKLSPETIKMLSVDDSVTKDESKSKQDEANEKQPSVALQVLKSKVLMFRLCVCSFWWITVTFIYYGLSINSVSLAGNSYVNYILTSLIEIPGYFLSAVTLDRFGRKRSIMAAFFTCGFSLVCLPFIPASYVVVVLTMVGKLSISMVFASIYIYTIELFPTPLRHSMLSVCSVVGRVGSTTAPQTPLLMAYMEALPYLLFGAMAGTSGLLMLLTPETLHSRLPDTVQQAEDIAGPRDNRPTDVIVD